MKTGKQLGDEPAQPTLEFSRYNEDCTFSSYTVEGLTKREHFAGLAMQRKHEPQTGIIGDRMKTAAFKKQIANYHTL